MAAVGGGANAETWDDDQIVRVKVETEEFRMARESRPGATVPQHLRQFAAHRVNELEAQFRVVMPRKVDGKTPTKKMKGEIQRQVTRQLNICKSTYYRLLKEKKRAEETGEEIRTPGRKRKRPSYILDSLDGFSLHSMRRRIRQMYVDGIIPNLDNLLQFATKDLEFNGSRTSLHRILTRKMGFKYRKLNGKKLLMERHDVQRLRNKFLDQWNEFFKSSRLFVYVDEARIWENHSVSKYWQRDGIHGIQAPLGKGRRLVVLHAGTKDGFLKNCDLFIESKLDSYKDVTAEIFLDWFESQLLPSIPPQSVIVMDDAPCHSIRAQKIPNSGHTKEEMIDWLSENGVTGVNVSMRKQFLYDLILEKKPKSTKFVINEIAKQHGHVVLRIPPYHSEYNPMELIWTQVKNRVAQLNSTFKMDAIKTLMKESIGLITSRNWQESIKRVNEICANDLSKITTWEDKLEELIVSIGGAGEDSSTASEGEE